MQVKTGSVSSSKYLAISSSLPCINHSIDASRKMLGSNSTEYDNVFGIAFLFWLLKYLMIWIRTLEYIPDLYKVGCIWCSN